MAVNEYNRVRVCRVVQRMCAHEWAEEKEHKYTVAKDPCLCVCAFVSVLFHRIMGKSVQQRVRDLVDLPDR